jgi:hypothetical protein
MFRLAIPGFLGLVVTLLWIYCILDVIATESILVRNLPKMAWLLIVIFVPTVGSIAWLALGRPPYAGWRPGDTGTRPAASARPRAVGPEDLPDFGTTPSADEARLRAWEEDLRRREEEIRRRQEPPAGQA